MQDYFLRELHSCNLYVLLMCKDDDMNNSTIVAFATPPGESAIAAVRVSGTMSSKIVCDVFSRKSKCVSRHVSLGRYIDVNGDIIDECLYVFFDYNSSYTGESSVEIYCHGNPFIQQKILEDLIKRGCKCAEPGEFTRRAFLNGKMDLSQAEAVEEIIRARSERALSAAHKLLSGELGRRISIWNDKIMNVLAEIESQIDFSDEDIPMFHVEHFKKEITELKISLEKTERTARYSNAIREGINMVIVGLPNAGKSSLLNTLVGHERALVSDEAGTTRDFISESINIGKHRVRLIDTAGIREDAQTSLEKSGIDKAVDCIQRGDFYLFVVDSSQPPAIFPQYIMSSISPDKTLVILNKSDLPASFDLSSFMPDFKKVSISLLDLSSAEFLKSEIEKTLESKSIVPETDILIVSARHAESLRVAGLELDAAIESAGKVSLEFLASRLRIAMNELSEILGRFDNEKVLDRVFSSFCIGK